MVRKKKHNLDAPDLPGLLVIALLPINGFRSMARALQEAVKTVRQLDRTLVARGSCQPAGAADVLFGGLSAAANKSRLWLAIAAVMALRTGPARRAAVHGLIALSVASAMNAVFKGILPSRPRPEHLGFP
ncbi:hypothetical protein M1D88_09700 [Arthrobacter sp. R1-13]